MLYNSIDKLILGRILKNRIRWHHMRIDNCNSNEHRGRGEVQGSTIRKVLDQYSGQTGNWNITNVVQHSARRSYQTLGGKKCKIGIPKSCGGQEGS